MERIHDELTRKEVVRLEALEAIKSQPDIDFVFDDEKMDDKPEDINIFDDIDFDLDEEIMDDKPKPQGLSDAVKAIEVTHLPHRSAALTMKMGIIFAHPINNPP
ncbi:hypothetical protein RhiirC2_776925 [Rhizophagus irregularis]|uniref:Uncharacterized protein n=1 Tax=Rhizophagus irregularis TaxID=588596 RepID=A0A2N1NFL3_9GLOM|nr:hypothetical protein RhiirC2_776925 [Rhizophagus irregularis]